jgi:dihydrofolate reductase
MRLVVHEFLTLDGVMQGPGGADEDRSGGFERGGWIVPLSDADMGEIVSGWFKSADAILLGRTTYTAMHGYWSQVNDPDNAAGIGLNNLPKYLVSSTVDNPAWKNTTVLKGDPIKAVANLKTRNGRELQVHGSWQLARALHRAGLVDEYRLIVFPVTVGGGKRLFDEGSPAAGYSMVEGRVTSGGATYLVLEPKRFSTGELAVVDGRESVVG